MSHALDTAHVRQGHAALVAHDDVIQSLLHRP